MIELKEIPEHDSPFVSRLPFFCPDPPVIDQDVAIKLMRPSRYAAESLGFFDTERRALARLKHPHIARLFDGGVTAEGLPWFIMELVDGEPLIVADLAYQIDNMEGIAVHRNARNETIVTLVSDDNFSFLQRNLLLQFALVGE